MKVRALLCRAAGIFSAAVIFGAGVMAGYPAADLSIKADASNYYGDFLYTAYSNGIEIISYRGTKTSITYPSKIEGKDVHKVNFFFTHPESVKNVTIPASVKVINPYKSDKNNGISAINVASGNTEYSSQDGVLFNKSKSLLIYYPRYKSNKDYTIPSSVREIDYSSFASLYLENLNIPKSVKSVDYNPFKLCSSLKSINVNSGNETYRSRNGVLYSKDMKYLYVYPQAAPATEYSLPDSVERILTDSMAYCNKIQKLHIGKGLNTYSYSTDFHIVQNLKAITVSKDNKYYKAVNGVLFSANMQTLICYPTAKTGDVYNVPEGVEYVNSDALNENKYLTGISFPKTLNKVYPFIFSTMKSLKEVAFFRSDVSIDYYYPAGGKKFTVHGYSNSTAQTFADKYNMKFEKITGTVPTSVSINKTSFSIGKDETVQLVAEVKPFYAKNRAVTWSSSNTAVATVSSGKVTAKKTGIADIKVVTYNGKRAVCKATAKNAPTSVTLTKGVLTLGVGESFTIGSNVNEGAASAKRTYRTSDSSIVRMTKTEWTGVFTAVKPGVAYVTVRTYNGKEHACKVTVKPAPGSVKASKDKIYLKVGQKASVSAIIPEGTGCADRTYTLLDNGKGILKMTKTKWTGEFIAQKPGFATIRVTTYNGKYAMCYVTVSK